MCDVTCARLSPSLPPLVSRRVFRVVVSCRLWQAVSMGLMSGTILLSVVAMIPYALTQVRAH